MCRSDEAAHPLLLSIFFHLYLISSGDASLSFSGVKIQQKGKNSYHYRANCYQNLASSLLVIDSSQQNIGSTSGQSCFYIEVQTFFNPLSKNVKESFVV